MTATLSGLAACALYLIATFWAARQIRQQSTPHRWSFLGLGAIALLLHALALKLLMKSDSGIYLGLFPVLSLITASGVGTVMLANLYRRLEWISLLVFPLSILTLLAALFIRTGYRPHVPEYGVGLHVIFSILAFAVLSIATFQSLLVLVQHRQLKQGNIKGLLSVLPPIQIMEAMLFELLWAGVTLLIVAIGIGFVVLDDLFAQQVAHKTILTLLSAVIFIGLLAGRYFLGWRGVTAVRLTMAGFALLMLGYMGSQLVLEVILKR